jgi:hypothetical protein
MDRYQGLASRRAGHPEPLLRGIASSVVIPPFCRNSAWQLLMATPRFYRNATTLVNQAGDHPVPVPLAS